MGHPILWLSEAYNHWGIIVCFRGGLPYKGAELPARSRVCMGGRRADGLWPFGKKIKAAAEIAVMPKTQRQAYAIF
jgi:hypothetical protein